MEKELPKPFLKKVADYLLSINPGDLSNLTIVLPNKRSALFLSQHLIASENRPLWAPRFFSIEEFIFSHGEKMKADASVLLFSLYHAYREVMGKSADTFKAFIPWGQILLDDFDELDANLIPVAEVFSYLSDAKAIELWNPNTGTLSEQQEAYLGFYRSLNLIYETFVQQLYSRRLSTPGLAAREVCESIRKGVFQPPPGLVVFAGLNALSESERFLVQYFVREQGAQCLWDADRYYMEDTNQEAGFFLREHLADEGERFRWMEDLISTRPLNIHITGVPGRIGQVKKASSIIQEWAHHGIDMDQRIAVVLADEGLLLPMLNAVPEAVHDINVTMGLPLKQTPGFTFLDAWLELLSEAGDSVRRSENPAEDSLVAYRIRTLLKLLTHPWMSYLLTGEMGEVDSLKKLLFDYISLQGITYLNQRSLASLLNRAGIPKADVALLFPAHALLAADIPKLGKQLIRSLHHGMGAPNPDSELGSDEEALYVFSQTFGFLEDIWSDFDVSDEPGVFRKIFDRICRAKQLSFSGEPLKGLQLMGLLETRSLDFDRIILLAANEDILPSGKHINSFIPFDIRQQFKLPGLHYRAAVFSYHFYRLLQRSVEVHLLYNTEPGEIGGGEMSRFLSQLQFELKDRNPLANLLSSSAALFPFHQQRHAIQFPKDDTIMQMLQERVAKGLSASSLNSFRQCSLMFYLKYVAGIEEPEDDIDDLGSSELGSLVHKALYEIYKPALSELLTLSILEEKLELTSAITMKCFQELFPGVNHTMGKNFLLLELAEAYVKSLIEYEIKWIKAREQRQELKILDLEKNHYRSLSIPGVNEVVALKGTIDRIDIIGGTCRIIDYKTGRLDNKDLQIKAIEDFEEEAKDKAFQLLFYAYLVADDPLAFPPPYSLAILSLRGLSKGPAYLSIDKESMIDSTHLAAFEAYLIQLIQNLLDPGQAFIQTPDEKNCRYCPYQLICNRWPAQSEF